MKCDRKCLLITAVILLVLLLTACESEPPEEEAALTHVGTALTWVSFGGRELQLSLLPLTCFRGLGADETVRTSNGDTDLATGIAIAGSELTAQEVRSSAQWQQPALCLHYDMERKRESLITELGQEMRLRLDGKDYQPQVVWYTDDMLYFIFDCPALPEGEPLLALAGERLIAVYE